VRHLHRERRPGRTDAFLETYRAALGSASQIPRRAVPSREAWTIWICIRKLRSSKLPTKNERNRRL